MGKSIYLSIAGVDPGWIIGKISDDIQNVLQSRGVTCRAGPPSQYNNENICYHLGYAYAKPERNAEVNSVFVTHIDDRFKEGLIKSNMDKFDSFICMSSDDRNYLISLGFDQEKVFGPPLPVRNDYVRPLSLGIFSSCYRDGRKNEKWLLRFAQSNPDASLLNYVFIGRAWGGFLEKFSKLGASFEWHVVDGALPYEYKFQQEKLSRLDYYFYLGYDGGAMGSYDGYAYGNRLILINESYHLDIPNVEHPITNYDDFNGAFTTIAAKQREKIDFFSNNCVSKYVDKLLEIWLGKCEPLEKSETSSTSGQEMLQKRRDHYSRVSIFRMLGMIKRRVSKLK